MVALEYVALDIETADARPEDVVAEFNRTWTPDRRWKPDTIGERYLRALEARQEKAALCDSSPVVAVSLKLGAEVRVLHAMRAEPPRVLEGAHIEGFGNERELLVALRVLLDPLPPDVPLVGHNVLGFDLPKLRRAFIRAGLRAPECFLLREWPVFDTMREARRYTLRGDSFFLSLEELAGELGLSTHKGLIDGARVPELVRAGDVETVCRYAALDVLAEAEVFEVLTGQAAGLA
jgi:hypothetical protein